MTRIVLERVFKEVFADDGTPLVDKYIGEIVIYTEQLDAQQMATCKTWPKEYKDKLKEHGFDVE